MNRLCALALVAIGFAAPAAARADHQVVEVGSTSVVVIQDSSLETLEGQLAFQAGSVYEPADKKGVAALLARALISGDPAQWFTSVGGTLESRVDLDAVRVHFSCPAADLDEALSRLAARLADTSYSSAVIDGAREALLADGRARAATADGVLEVAADRLLFGRFPYYHRALDLDSVAKLTPADVSAYHREHLGANRLTVGVASALSVSDVQAAVQARLGDLGDVAPSPPDPAPPIYSPWRTRIYLIDDPDAKQSEVRILSPGTTRRSQTHGPVEAWTWVIGHGDQAPLAEYVNREVTNATKGAQEVPSEVEVDFDSDWNRLGFFRGRITSPNDAVGKALHSYMELLQGWYMAVIPADKRADAAKRFRAEEDALLADPRVRLTRAVDVTLHGFPKNYYDARAAVIETVTGKLMGGSVLSQILMKSFLIIAIGPADKIREGLEYFADVSDFSFEDPVTAPDVQARVDALLAAMGGREAWANLRGVEVESEAEVLQSGEKRIRKAHVWRYFDSVHSFTEQALKVMDITTAVDGTPGWSSGPLGARGLANSMYRNQVRNDARWLYCLLHRLAIREPGLVARADEKGRLVFSDRIGEVCWIEVGDNDRPTMMGWTEGLDNLMIFSSWAKSGDYVYAKELKLPYEIGTNEMTAPQVVRRFVPNPPLDRARFARPDRDS